MKRLVSFLAVALAAAGAAHAAVPTPGAPQTAPVAIVGGTVHTVSGSAIENGVVVFDGGRITAVGMASSTTIPAGAVRVEAAGKHVYPGLIDPWTTIGLTEVEAVRSSRDFAETAPIAPNVRADVAFHPESEIIPVTRSNGVLLAHVTPRGGVLSGGSALMALDGWTNAEMTVRAPVGVVINWPAMVIVPAADGGPEDRQREARAVRLGQLAQAFDQAEAYRVARRAHPDETPEDARWEAMLPVLDGKLPLFAVAEEVHQIEAAVAFASERKLKLVIYGGYDAPMVASLLKAHDVPVIVSATVRLPRRRSDGYDEPATTPAQLEKAGVRYCIGNGGGAWNERNLPYSAATAEAFGLTSDQALRAITLSTAEILGVADRVGSLAPGKDATLFVSDGDILDEPTHVVDAWIGGRQVDLTDRQKVLNEKYREKYRRVSAATTAGTAGTAGGH